MNILVVHDREEVAKKIISLSEEVASNDGSVDLAEDTHTARQFLSKNIYDLLIIDLTLPFTKGGDADYSKADELLDELFNLGTLNVPGDVIGITKDAEALSSIRTSLGPHLMTAIDQDDENNWETYLKDKIAYAKKSALTRTISINQHYMYDALIVTALDEEMAPYNEHFEMSEISYFPDAKEFLFKDKNNQTRKGVAYSIGRSGQPAAASFSQSLISTFRPKIAMMSGFCGGVKGKVNLGDIVFFEAAYAWDYGKWNEEKTLFKNKSVFTSRPNPIEITDSELHRAARKILQSDFIRNHEFEKDLLALSSGKLNKVAMHIKHAASGSAVVANDDIIKKIRNLNESIWAVDMESYGFYEAAKNTNVIKPLFMCVKAVSDFCNGDKDDDYHELCASISSKIIVEIIKNQHDFN